MVKPEASPIFYSIVYFLLRFVLLAYSVPQTALITQIPGFSGTLPSKHYSGYVTIDESHGKKLFYYFVESEGNPLKDPVVLWLNGGPGCSSFDGFVYEHGPFNFEAANQSDDLPKLHLNPYSWSKVSNIIYLDSPAGVGLSYSKNETDYITGDVKTALDSHIFLLRWFELYPEYLSNPLFISGESYAGVYVPTLAYEGYLVGNGVTDEKFDGNALVPFAHGMGLISDDLFEEVSNACKGNFYQPLGENCESKLAKVDADISGLNIYDILEPCYYDTDTREVTDIKIRLPSSFLQLGETDRPLPVRKRMLGRAWPFRAPVREGIVPTWPQLLNSRSVPCTDDEVATSWLNSAAVRKAIHADEVSLLNFIVHITFRKQLPYEFRNQTGSVAGTWELCTGRISFRHDAGSMIQYHKNLTLGDIEHSYSGGSLNICDYFMYTQGYENNLTFLTIKGAGHTVPEYKPREALDFYSRFLAGKPMEIVATRYLGVPILADLGLADEANEYVNGIGWTKFVGMKQPIFIQLTLEFISSLQVNLKLRTEISEGWNQGTGVNVDVVTEPIEVGQDAAGPS
ncbi:hypothetical protein GH714_025078 [Hevea brasiliensis]|uniref:Carboxypeptidase n=1 Tax=Hevea brasiliensis TaxID=3981 RepID=A0A6A6KX20_HEVBR|nr:hypothetical protein GH714_025078 [Hevea brasiliensis]